MGFTWSRTLFVGLLMWTLGVIVQIVILGRQTDPSVFSVGRDIQMTCIIIYPASVLVAHSYLLHSGGGGRRRLVGCIMIFAAVLGIGLVVVFHNLLVALFMPRVAVINMLMVDCAALLLMGVVFLCYRPPHQ